MKMVIQMEHDFDDVLIKPRYSTIESRKDVNIYRELGGQQVLPIIASNMDSIGTHKMDVALNNLKAMTARRTGHWVVHSPRSFLTLGINDDIIKTRWICIDTANGHTQKFLDYIKKVRKVNPFSIIMAGNIGTPEMVVPVAQAGADIVKVGLGSGLACTTREMTGVGYPQLQLIKDCVNQPYLVPGEIVFVHKGVPIDKKTRTIPICSDGGVRTPGDICKALAAGAQYVMLGGLLAGHNECDGVFYGGASEVAMKKHGKLAPYRVAEGVVVGVEYKGAVSDTIQKIEGGLRSMMSYIGARTLDEISEKAEFINAK